MSRVLVLSESDINSILNMKMAIDAVEDVYIQKYNGSGVLFPMVFHEFEPGVADMDIKSGHLGSSDVYGLKLVSWFLNNTDKNLPQLYGTTLLFDDKTGEPIALLNAGGVTGMRTGAAGAIGGKYLARKDSKVLLVVGVGEQCPYQIAASLITIESLENIYIVNPNNPEKAEERLELIKDKVAELLNSANVKKDYSIKFSLDIESATKESDIIITVTSSQEPMIRDEWVKDGTHFSCVGADMSGKQEIDGNILKRAKIFVDDIQQSISVGECECAVKNNLISKGDIAGEIGELISGDVLGRENDDEITVFDSTGIALQDLLVSKMIYDAAVKVQIGTYVEL